MRLSGQFYCVPFTGEATNFRQIITQGHINQRAAQEKLEPKSSHSQIPFPFCQAALHALFLLFSESLGGKKSIILEKACEACLLSPTSHSPPPPQALLVTLCLLTPATPRTVSSALFCRFFFPAHSCSFYLQAACNMGFKNYRNQEDE